MTQKEIKRKLDLHLKWLRGERGGERADLFGANLINVDLSEANLSRAYLPGANLSGADLSGANLSGANLSGADLSGANLSGADLSGAYLSGADLSEANLINVDLSEANLSRANLFEANLFGANLFGANLDYSSWPLWCGSLHAKIDRRIFCQLAYHLCRCVVDDDDCKAAQKMLYGLANEFHRANECGKLE